MNLVTVEQNVVLFIQLNWKKSKKILQETKLKSHKIFFWQNNFFRSFLARKLWRQRNKYFKNIQPGKIHLKIFNNPENICVKRNENI